MAPNACKTLCNSRIMWKGNWFTERLNAEDMFLLIEIDENCFFSSFQRILAVSLVSLNVTRKLFYWFSIFHLRNKCINTHTNVLAFLVQKSMKMIWRSCDPMHLCSEVHTAFLRNIAIIYYEYVIVNICFIQ